MKTRETSDTPASAESTPSDAAAWLASQNFGKYIVPFSTLLKIVLIPGKKVFLGDQKTYEGRLEIEASPLYLDTDTEPVGMIDLSKWALDGHGDLDRERLKTLAVKLESNPFFCANRPGAKKAFHRYDDYMISYEIGAEKRAEERRKKLAQEEALMKPVTRLSPAPA